MSALFALAAKLAAHGGVVTDIRIVGHITHDEISLRGRIRGDQADRARDEANCTQAEDAFDRQALPMLCPECEGTNLNEPLQICYDCDSDVPEFIEQEESDGN